MRTYVQMPMNYQIAGLEGNAKRRINLVEGALNRHVNITETAAKAGIRAGKTVVGDVVAIRPASAILDLAGGIVDVVDVGVIGNVKASLDHFRSQAFISTYRL